MTGGSEPEGHGWTKGRILMVVILLANGFEESEAIVPADMLRRAGVEVRLAAVEGTQVTSSHGVTRSATARPP